VLEDRTKMDVSVHPRPISWKIEIDCQRDAERKARNHAREIVPHRLIEIRAQLREVFNIGQNLALGLSVASGVKTRIVGTGYRYLETA